MRLVTFETGGRRRVGILDGKAIVDLSSFGLPQDMREFIALGPAGLAQAQTLLERDDASARIEASHARILAPLPQLHRNAFAVGKNYRAHAEEFHGSGFDSTNAKDAVPAAPVIFTKATTTVIGPGDTILVSLDPTGTSDYEGELVAVIGRAARGLSKADAMSAVYGYTVGNDVTSRALQSKHNQFFIGKSIDTYFPLGPCIVTVDEIPDPSKLRLLTYVNGERRQDAEVSDLIFDIPTLIATLALTMTLEPGDVISTGTPAGVGIGLRPAQYLKPGDVVRVEIPGIGILENPVG